MRNNYTYFQKRLMKEITTDLEKAILLYIKLAICNLTKSLWAYNVN